MFYIFLAVGALYVFGMFKQAAQEKGLNKWQWAFAGLFTFPVVSKLTSFLIALIAVQFVQVPFSTIVSIGISLIAIAAGIFAVKMLYKKLLSSKSNIYLTRSISK